MHILSIGCGNMASAMIGQWLNHDVKVTVVSPNNKDPFGGAVVAYNDINDVNHTDFDFIFYMAKPQMVNDILPNYTRFKAIPWVTVAAGVPIESYQAILGNETTIIRMMPNTPAMIGEGVCPVYTDSDIPHKVKTNLETLLSPLGAWGWLNSEDDLHAVTALSGSGVAYIYYLMDCMADIAQTMGLSNEQATQWAIQTVTGAGKMAQHSDDDLETLRVKVTSPKGVTEQALKALMEDKRLHTLMQDTMHQAITRSKELSK